MVSVSLEFSQAARLVADEARRLGLQAPAFRSPPRVDGATRTIRRGPGVPIVAVVVRGRPRADVIADLIEGVLVANAATGAPARAYRRRLTAVVDAAQQAAGSAARSRPWGPAGSVGAPARVA